MPRALLGPFLTEADAEAGRIVMRSADAVVTASLVDSIDDITHWYAMNNGRACRAFAGADRLGVNHVGDVIQFDPFTSIVRDDVPPHMDDFLARAADRRVQRSGETA